MNMNGLDKITEEILTLANIQAGDILNEANEKAAAIYKKGENDRIELSLRFDEIAAKDCGEIITRAESVNRQNRRLALLKTRNQIIDEVIDEAKAKLKELGDKEGRFKVTAQGDILFDNSLDAIFDAEEQTLRDKAYEVLSSEEP